MEIITQEVLTGTPWELLYADELIWITDSEDSLCEKRLKWKRDWNVKI